MVEDDGGEEKWIKEEVRNGGDLLKREKENFGKKCRKFRREIEREGDELVREMRKIRKDMKKDLARA